MTLADGRVVTLTKVSHDSFPVPITPLASWPPVDPTNPGRLRYSPDYQILAIDTGTQWLPVINTLGVHYPEAYEGADFSQKINNLIDALPAEGGVIDARGFIGAQSCSETIIIDKPVLLLLGYCTITSAVTPMFAITTGAIIQGLSPLGTTIRTSTVSQTAIAINTTNGVHIGGLSIDHVGLTKTSGAGIHVTAPSGENVGSRFINLRIVSQYVGLHTISASRWVLYASSIGESKLYGVLVQNQAVIDSGDSVIDSCIIENSATSAGIFAIYHLSASGLRVVNCRVIGHGYGYVLDVLNTARVVSLSGNYFSGQGTNCIALIRNSGSAVFQGVTISHNTLIVTGTAVYCGTLGVEYLTITNNVISVLSPAAGIHIAAATYGYLAGNTIVANGLSSSGIVIQAAAQFIHVGENIFPGVTDRINDLSTNGFVSPYILRGQVSLDPGSIPSASRGSVTFALPGCTTIDRIIMEPPATLNDDLLLQWAGVLVDGTVTVYLYNGSGIAIDEGALVWKYLWFNATYQQT